MKIKLSNAGKRFNREWIFKKADLEFNTAFSYAITGPNGSGKSTLLQCIGGMLQLSEGSISFTEGHQATEPDQLWKQVSFCAPYFEVIEEFTFTEFLDFHRQFKSFINNYTVKQVIQAVGMEKAAQKQIRYYSSGMKQRVKLAQAIFSDSPVVLLDEPCSNLDTNGIELYHSLISDFCKNRLVIVCSNDPVEYSFCEETYSILAYK